MLEQLLEELVERLRGHGGDTTAVEVKSALGGLPTTLEQSLCALANLPGGGWVILGLGEAAGFVPVGLTGIQPLKQGLAGKARSCTPPGSGCYGSAEGFADRGRCEPRDGASAFARLSDRFQRLETINSSG